MSAAKTASIETKGILELKPLLSSPGPCVSVYLALAATPLNQSVKSNSLEWKETIRTIEPKIDEFGREGRELLSAISDWESISSGQESECASVAVFRSPAISQTIWLQTPVDNRAIVAPHFYIRPLLPELIQPKTFYILALSQKNVRLLRCTSTTSEEVEIPEGTPRSFDAYMNTAKPDHVRNNMASAGPSGGHTKGISQSTSTDREDKGEYLGHFFQQIDHSVNELLRGKSDPVVLAAVEYELAQYRTINTYPHLLEESVQGAPNSLKSGEMHARALDALTRNRENKVDQILAEYDHKVGAGASNRLKDVVTAAHDGRVLTLLVSDSLETTGRFDEATHSVSARQSGTSEDEDLINAAAVQTILHAGRVMSAPNAKMPNGAPLAAIFRY